MASDPSELPSSEPDDEGPLPEFRDVPTSENETVHIAYFDAVLWFSDQLNGFVETDRRDTWDEAEGPKPEQLLRRAEALGIDINLQVDPETGRLVWDASHDLTAAVDALAVYRLVGAVLHRWHRHRRSHGGAWSGLRLGEVHRGHYGRAGNGRACRE